MIERIMSKTEVAIDRFLEKKAVNYFCPGEPVFMFDLKDDTGKNYHYFIEVKDDYFTVEVSSLTTINFNDKEQLFRALNLLNMLRLKDFFRKGTFVIEPDSGCIKHYQKIDCFTEPSEASEEVIHKSLITPQIEFQLISPIISEYVFDGNEIDINKSIALSILDLLF